MPSAGEGVTSDALRITLWKLASETVRGFRHDMHHVIGLSSDGQLLIVYCHHFMPCSRCGCRVASCVRLLIRPQKFMKTTRTNAVRERKKKEGNQKCSTSTICIHHNYRPYLQCNNRIMNNCLKAMHLILRQHQCYTVRSTTTKKYLNTSMINRL